MNYRIMFKWIPKWMMVVLILSILISSFDGIYFASLIAGISSFKRNSSLKDLVQFAVIFVGARLIIFLGMQIGWSIRARIIKHLNIKLKENYIKQFLKSNERNENVSDKLSVIINDFQLIEDHYFSPVLETINYFATVLTSILYILSIDFWLGLLFISLSCVSLIPSVLFSNRLNAETKEFSEKNQLYLRSITDIFHNKHTIKTYMVDSPIFKRMAQTLSSREDGQFKLSVFQTFVSLSASALSFVGGMIPILIGIYFFIEGNYDPSLLVAMYLASDRIAYPVRIISYYLGQINSTKALRTGIDCTNHGELISDQQQILSEIRAINIENLTYATDDQLLFEHYNQIFHPGEKYLIVGPSGRGKTTLLKLIQGWILPKSGNVFYKTDKNCILASDMVGSNDVAYISQNPIVFNDTLRFNLIFSDDKKRDSEIVEILKTLKLWNELGEHCLDNTIESSGKNLSGGQIQRIEIARALLSNPKVLLIDEMTAALDSDSAQKVRRYIWQLPITVIEVAHHYNSEMIKEFGVKIIEL